MTRTEHTPSAIAPLLLTRRRALGLLAAAGATIASAHAIRAQDSTPESTPESTPTIKSNAVGEMPTTGGLRPGPVGQQPPETITSSTRAAIASRV